MTDQTQAELMMEYYKARPNKDIPHSEVVDWATVEWKRRTGEALRDPDRAIRKLHQEGALIKARKGVYRYDPRNTRSKRLANFSSALKAEILARDGRKCVICGKGEKEGMELHVDHIRPQDLGGEATLENGQTLCSQHNMLKKNLKQTETGKRMFIRLHEFAVSEGDETLRDFCAEILSTYDKYDINSHIKWK